VQWVNLTDAELWHAITQNTDELLALLALDADIDANELDKRADPMRSHLKTINRLQREYRGYAAELRRRYSLAAPAASQSSLRSAALDLGEHLGC
jgi:hypothetical protein